MLDNKDKNTFKNASKEVDLKFLMEALIGEREFNLGKLELKMKSIMGVVLMKKMIEIQLLATGDMLVSKNVHGECCSKPFLIHKFLNFVVCIVSLQLLLTLFFLVQILSPRAPKEKIALSLALPPNPIFHSHMKHIAINFHFVQDQTKIDVLNKQSILQGHDKSTPSIAPIKP
ncbi:hypothetical protein CK203_066309 [Vitis vinifera]|uniref:Uncharacterized protein n=1 Tax=Vitis vinifera TaxID=29760 RepID=A0A438FP94_VITVI|nr:hypothetical protein CK203_066309 [Vitis vinifera]